MDTTGVKKDHGWAWVVLIACFLNNALVSAMAQCSSVLFVDLRETFGCSAWALSAVQGTAMALWLAPAPISNALAVRFTSRKVVFAGGIIASAGLLASSFVTTIAWFFVFQGLVVGVGYGLAYSPCLVTLVAHFDKRRGVAVSIALTGAAIGRVALPVVIRYLANGYGLRGAILVQGALLANVCVCAMLLRPPTDRANVSTLVIDETHTEDVLTRTDTIDCKTDTCLSNLSDENETILIQNNLENNCEISTLGDEKRADIHVANDHNLLGTSSKPLRRNDKIETAKKYTKYFNWTILCNPVFVIYLIAAMGSEVTWELSFLLLPQIAIEKGFSKEAAALLLTVSGSADVFVRLSVGRLADLHIFPIRYIFTAVVILTGVNAMVVPFAYTYTALAVISVFYGIFGGTFGPLQILVLGDVVGAENISSFFGITCLSQALSIAAAAQIVGSLKDVTGSWNASFWFTAASSLISGGVACLEPLLARRNAPRDVGHKT